SSVSSGGRAMLKYTVAPHAKMTIEMPNGMIDHISSSGTEPVMGAPTAAGFLRWYRTAKTTMDAAMRIEKNAVSATRKKYRLSTSLASVDACSGKRGEPDHITNTFLILDS